MLKAQDARNQVREQIKRMDLGSRQSVSDRVVERFLSSKVSDVWQGSKVGLYLALEDELQIHSLQSFFRSSGASIYLPRIVDAQAAEMSFAKADGPFEAGPWGILQPSANTEVIHPSDLNWIFVPGLAFGEHGERVGRGKGFYDRYLQRAHQAKRIALVFDFQVFSELEQGPLDQQMDEIWTERRWVVCPIRK
jgi:5-formyltetrahydrofolate cyclo-ligase